jgi:hypothetical protein
MEHAWLWPIRLFIDWAEIRVLAHATGRMENPMIRVNSSQGIADGIVFDDLSSLPEAYRNLLAAREVVYCTELRVDGHTYAGTIIAKDPQMAERVAFGRGLGEQIIGLLVLSGSTS